MLPDANAKQASKLASLDREESKLASFDSAIAPLEERAGKPLRGPWRREWRARFHQSPEGFCRVRDDVLARPWVQSHFAYFNRLLNDDDHLEPAPESPTPERCPSCGYAAPLHVADCEHAPGSRNREEAA